MLKFIIYCLNVLAAVGGFQDTSTNPTTSPTPSPTELNEVVAIEIDGVPKCLGAFVVTEAKQEPRFIATAAHCVYGVQASRLKLKGKEIQKEVKRVMVHPYYMPPSPDYDIALLKINTTDKTGLLLPNELPSGTDLTAFDWDLKESTPKDISATLEDRQSCRAKMANHTVVSKRMLCVNTGSVMDGSPLTQLTQKKNQDPKKYIVGVGSYYVRGNREKYPKIFTSTTNSEIYSFMKKYID